MSSCVRLFVTRVAKETASVENLPFKPFVGVKGVGGRKGSNFSRFKLDFLGS